MTRIPDAGIFAEFQEVFIMVRVALIQGSPRYVNNCPGQNSKTLLLVNRIMSENIDVDIDLIDLSIKGDGNIVQPCKGCVSTSAFHCRYKCDCYVANSEKFPDFMHNEKIYDRLEKADAFMLLTPVHWYSVTSVVKNFFDRLVCVNLTITAELAQQLALNKDAKKTRALEKSENYKSLLKNHYAGKYAAFLAHGDDGGVDYNEFSGSGPPMPDSLRKFLYKDGTEGRANDPINAIMPLVWQCRYSGIHVPDDLVMGFHATSGVSYSEAMDLATYNLDDYYARGLTLFSRLLTYLRSSA